MAIDLQNLMAIIDQNTIAKMLYWCTIKSYKYKNIRRLKLLVLSYGPPQKIAIL